MRRKDARATYINFLASFMPYMRTSIIHTLVLSVFVLMAGVACSSPTDSDVSTMALSQPLATGIYYTDINGRILGVIGEPADNPSDGDNVYLDLLSPNPAMGSFGVSYTLYAPSVVTVWIEPAVLNTFSFEGESDMATMLGGATFPTPQISARDENFVIHAGKQVQGYHTISVDASSLPIGAYRVYLQAQKSLVWRDILVVRNR